MGQKVNPVSNRLGIIRGWDSNWYGGKKYGDTLLEDSKIRKYLNARLTIVDYPTGYILKPQTEEFDNMPEFEDLAMRLAEIMGIQTVPHALIKMNDESFPVLNQEKKQMMIETIKLAKSNFDSVGGEIETVVYNCPSGLGEPFFDSVESEVSSLLFSIPAVKGVSFGKGFAFSRFFGSEVNDSLYYDGEKVKTKTNNNGGINGGITNGMPIVINTVIKPTPSIGKEQDTIDLLKKENVKLKIEGRHDPCICHRSVVVIESMVAIAILNLYISREGRLSMK